MTESMREAFEKWWRANHPHDWFAKARNGKPLPHLDRLLVLEKCREAYAAGQAAERERAARVCEEMSGLNNDFDTGCRHCAAAIRRRPEG